MLIVTADSDWIWIIDLEPTEENTLIRKRQYPFVGSIEILGD